MKVLLISFIWFSSQNNQKLFPVCEPARLGCEPPHESGRYVLSGRGVRIKLKSRKLYGNDVMMFVSALENIRETTV